MQAVFLLYDYRLYPNVDTLLRAFGIAQLAANAVVRYKVTCFPCLRPAEGFEYVFELQFLSCKIIIILQVLNVK